MLLLRQDSLLIVTMTQNNLTAQRPTTWQLLQVLLLVRVNADCNSTCIISMLLRNMASQTSSSRVRWAEQRRSCQFLHPSRLMAQSTLLTMCSVTCMRLHLNSLRAKAWSARAIRWPRSRLQAARLELWYTPTLLKQLVRWQYLSQLVRQLWSMYWTSLRSQTSHWPTLT